MKGAEHKLLNLGFASSFTAKLDTFCFYHFFAVDPDPGPAVFFSGIIEAHLEHDLMSLPGFKDTFFGPPANTKRL